MPLARHAVADSHGLALPSRTYNESGYFLAVETAFKNWEAMQSPGEFVVRGGADKFIGSDLEMRLRDKGIKTVIVSGTSAQGAVVGTSNGAVQRGYKAVVPVDGMSAEHPYNEQYAPWHLYNGPVNLTENVTLTRSDLIKFSN
jgi:nicotinamidase-related amidase